MNLIEKVDGVLVEDESGCKREREVEERSPYIDLSKAPIRVLSLLCRWPVL